MTPFPSWCSCTLVYPERPVPCPCVERYGVIYCRACAEQYGVKWPEEPPTPMEDAACLTTR